MVRRNPRYVRAEHRYLHRCQSRIATPGAAIGMYRRIEGCRIKYFEQPVEGIERMAQVARAIDAPVMADESAWNAHDVIEIIERRAARWCPSIQPSPADFTGQCKVAAVCKASGIVCNVNGSIETGIGKSRKRALGRGAER